MMTRLYDDPATMSLSNDMLKWSCRWADPVLPTCLTRGESIEKKSRHLPSAGVASDDEAIAMFMPDFRE